LNPDKTPEEFNRRAWPLLLENIKEQRAAEEQKALRERLAAKYRNYF
jgi:hypothetical protein